MSKFVDRRRFVSSANSSSADTPGVLMMVHVDEFEAIRLEWGSPASKRAEGIIREAVSNAVREQDIVSEVGPARYIVFAVNARLTQGNQIAERVRKAVAETMFQPAPGETVKLSVSIGGVLSAPKQDAELMIGLAEECLGTARNSGNGNVVMKTYFRAKKAA